MPRLRTGLLTLFTALVLAVVGLPGPAIAQEGPVEDGADSHSIERLYLAALGRAGEPDGVAYWSEVRDGRVPLAEIAGHFLAAPEFAARYGETDDDGFIDVAYANVLGRTPDPDGREFWRSVLAAGMPRGIVLVGFSDSAEFKVRSDLVGEPWRPPFAELPRGGTALFPAFRLVAEYGHPEVAALGVLGEKDAASAATATQARADEYAALGDRPVVPTFEIIASVAQARAGGDGLYSYKTPIAVIRPWLDALREVQGYLVLDLQPGRAEFIDQARFYEPLLRDPDVGLALDPEWSVDAPDTPAGTIGHTTAAEINEVSAFLADLVERYNLADKLLVIHRFEAFMVEDPENIVERDGVTILFHADGFGSREAKMGDYRTLLPDRFARGFKLFLDEDRDMFRPDEVMAFDPPPDMVSYQ